VDDRAASLVVIGASAGGLEPLRRIVAELPGSLPTAVAVVLHIPPDGSRLPDILNRQTEMAAAHAADGDPIVAGRIYVAPPDHHLLVRDGRCALVRGPRENGVRPAIDPLFRSAAASYGSRVVAVVLSGSGGDGTAGTAAVSSRGGCVIVQDPGEASFPHMPETVLARDHPDHVLPTARIAPAVVAAVKKLPVRASVSENGRDEMKLEISPAELGRESIGLAEPPGAPSAFVCPACGGVLWEVGDGVHRFRCRVGHAYSDVSVLAYGGEEIDRGRGRCGG
jgi:two-component system, chemotaxis family, protein-glutamate methylesterase/glutaminase